MALQVCYYSSILFYVFFEENHFVCQPIILFPSHSEQEPQTELVAQLSQEFYNNRTIETLLNNLSKMDFEVC